MYRTILTMLWFAVAGGLVTWVAIPIIRARTKSLSRAATSQFHHTHDGAISRLGGVAMAASFVIVSLLLFLIIRGDELETRHALVFVGGALAMFGLGFWDDIKPLGAKKKLLAQMLIAVAVWWGGIQIDRIQNPFNHQVYPLTAAGCVLTVLWLVAFPNLINLIDGIDGLAGGISLMLLALLCYVGPSAGSSFTTYSAAAMVGALLAFLRFNFPPAKIFMGDGGAYFLGFLIAEVSITDSHKGTIVAALVAPLFVLGLPLLDVTLAVLRRGLKGFSVFRADRSHIHHKLLNIGYTPRRAVLTLYFGSSFFLVLALVAYWSRGRLIPVLVGIAAVFLIFAFQSFSFSREWLTVGKHLANSIRMRETIQYALTLSQWFQIEARRCDTLDNLWSDFKFLLLKVNFHRVILNGPEGKRGWESNNPAPSSFHHCQLQLSRQHSMEFSMSTDGIDRDLFAHLCEIAAEAWQKALAIYNASGHVSTTVITIAPPASIANGTRRYVPIAWNDSEKPSRSDANWATLV